VAVTSFNPELLLRLQPRLLNMGYSEATSMSVELLSHAFTVGIFRFTLLPRATMFVPAVNKANMLRGAFGQAFRRLCCVPQCVNARECPLASSCPYKAIFEPSPPPDTDRLSKNQDIPRPFVFRAPLTDKTKFQPGEEFQFDLVLIGRALDHLPYFVLSFRDLAVQGLGLNRAKCELRHVCEAKPDDNGQVQTEDQCATGQSHVIYDSVDQVFHSPQGLDLKSWIDRRVGQLSCGTAALGCASRIPGSSDGQITRSPGLPLAPVDHRIRVNFLTPTLLKAENSVKRSADFHHLIKRLRDRINALSTFFGTGPLPIDFAGLGVRAEQVRTASSDVQWIERFRTSSKTHQRHELSGFTGSAVYQGKLDEFLPWLALGELIHLGKHTAWGSGWISVST
jgi:hypothetical protein